jgi:hypothetical protein
VVRNSGPRPLRGGRAGTPAGAGRLASPDYVEDQDGKERICV